MMFTNRDRRDRQPRARSRGEGSLGSDGRPLSRARPPRDRGGRVRGRLDSRHASAGGAVTGVTVAATLDGLPLACVTGIDMPLGLLGAGWRDADRLARRALGRRGVTVFAIPPRPVWECASYAEASRACRDLTGKGFSVQAWGLRRKIAEADTYRRRAASSVPPVRLYEVHPELSFTAMAGAPLRGRQAHAGRAGRPPRTARRGRHHPPAQGRGRRGRRPARRGRRRLVRPPHRRRPGNGPHQPRPAGRRRHRDRDPLLIGRSRGRQRRLAEIPNGRQAPRARSD